MNGLQQRLLLSFETVVVSYGGRELLTIRPNSSMAAEPPFRSRRPPTKQRQSRRFELRFATQKLNKDKLGGRGSCLAPPYARMTAWSEGSARCAGHSLRSFRHASCARSPCPCVTAPCGRGQHARSLPHGGSVVSSEQMSSTKVSSSAANCDCRSAMLDPNHTLALRAFATL